MTVWLITMVPGKTGEVITILNPRLSPRSVGKIMERLYVERREGPHGFLEDTTTGKARCPWRIGALDGIPYGDELWCGAGDRFYWARKVDKIRIVTDELGTRDLSGQKGSAPT